MAELSSFPKPFNAAIIGSSGGIGKAFAQSLERHDQVGHVFKFSRQGGDAVLLDLCDEEQIKEAAQTIQEPVHLIIVSTGLLHDKDILPEKSISGLNQEVMERVFLVNTIGPALIAKYFMPLLPRTGKSVFAALSARVGSISDNRLGGWHSYRASKAALNMMIKNIAIETARKHKEASVIGLHPGTVDTSLSSPFQSHIKEGKLFTPEQSANYLLDVINQVKADDTGKIFAWDGQEIEP